MIERNVWTPIPKQSNLKIIGTKWLYTNKYDEEGHINTFKTQLVALGNNQQEGLDYKETFSLVVNFSLIRFLAALFICILG